MGEGTLHFDNKMLVHSSSIIAFNFTAWIWKTEHVIFMWSVDMWLYCKKYFRQNKGILQISQQFLPN